MDGASSGTRTVRTPPPHLLNSSTREQQLEDFFRGLITNSLRLLVAVSGLLSKEDHESLCGFLWQSCLTQASYEIQPLVGFMLYLEFVPSMIHYNHTGYVFDYAGRGECSDDLTRSNTDGHQKVCLRDATPMPTVDSGFDLAHRLPVVFSQGAA